MDFASRTTELLWIGALAAVPLAGAVGLLCRVGRCRPATRHALWSVVLASFLTPAAAGLLWRPDWLTSARLMAAAEAWTSAPAADSSIAHAPSPHAPSPPAAQPPAPVFVTDPASPHVPSDDRAGLGGGTDAPHFHQRAAVAPMDGPTGALPALVRAAPRLTSDRLAAPIPNRDPAGRPSASVDGPAAARTEPAGAIHVKRAGQSPVRTSPPRSFSAPVLQAHPSPRPASPIDSSSGVAAPREARPAWMIEMNTWLARALNLRDTIAALPPLPLPVWAGGACLLGLTALVRLYRARRLLRTGRPAPDDVRRLVKRAATQLRLTPPRTVVVDDRVSPMIWCGWKPVLVIPAGLWDELEGDSRYAVIVHELAHLRRGDHRACWIEAIVGLVYWWHPAAWWARRRLREEADLCCDAWVTNLLPNKRRAYAEALVTTKSYLSMPGRRVTPGLGMMTGRTKRLARRLTMVMTQRSTPRTSAMGAAIALMAAAAGMFVTPSLACPPEHESKSSSGRTVIIVPKASGSAKLKAEKAERAARAPKAPKPAQAGEPDVEFLGEAPALEAMKAGRARGRAGSAAPSEPAGSAADAQLRRLEAQLHELEARLEKLSQRALEGTSPAGRPSAPRATRPRAALEPSRALPPSMPVAPAAPSAPHAPSALRTLITPEMPAAAAPAPPAAPVAPGQPSPRPARAPRGVQPPQPAMPAPPAPSPQPSPQARLERMTADQSHDVQPAMPTETVVATPAARATVNFGATSIARIAPLVTEDLEFVPLTAEPLILNRPVSDVIIHDAQEARRYNLPSGKLDALTQLMARRDVPILIERHESYLVVHATPDQHRTFEAFLRLIHPSSVGAEHQELDLHSQLVKPWSLTDLVAAEQDARERYTEAARAYRHSHQVQLERLHTALVDLASRRAAQEQHVDGLRNAAEKMRRSADRIRAKADSLRERLEAVAAPEARRQQLAASDALLAQADSTQAQADSMDSQADEIEAQMDDIESAAAELEAQIDEIADELDAQAEELDEAVEETAEAVEADKIDAAPEATQDDESSCESAGVDRDEANCDDAEHDDNASGAGRHQHEHDELMSRPDSNR